jgi:hypothetical protein
LTKTRVLLIKFMELCFFLSPIKLYADTSYKQLQLGFLP